MVCPTSCLPYIDCCPTCQFLWSQNVSFVTSGLPYFMFALSKMSLPYACLPYRKCCPTWQFFFSSKWNICNFWFALLHVCPFWDVIALHLFALQKMLPYQMYFFQRIFKIFVRSVTNVVGIYLWYIMYHLYLWYEYTILNLCVANWLFITFAQMYFFFLKYKCTNILFFTFVYQIDHL